MNNNIRKYYFYRPADSYKAFCSKCGHSVMQDHYNLVKHAEQCCGTENALLQILNENSYFYTLESVNGQVLKMVIAVPEMVINERNPSLYKGGRWKSIYQAEFRPNSREVKEEGMYNLNTWLYLIEQKQVRYIGDTSPSQVIHQVFSVVPEIYDLTMFCHIYQTKGYRTVPFTVTDAIHQKMTYRSREDHHSYEGNLYGELVNTDGEEVLVIRCYYHPLRGQRRFFSAAIADGIMVMHREPEDMSFREFWTLDYRNRIPKNVITRFDALNFSFGIRAYLEGGGTNILLPLFCSGNYHKGMELLIKSGYSVYADAYFSGYSMKESSLFGKEPWPMDYSNVPALLGLPKALLKQNRTELLAFEAVRERISLIYSRQRSLLEGVPLNTAVRNFLMAQDVLHDHSIQRNRIPGLSRLTVQETRRMLMYISKLTFPEYQLYTDYLCMKFHTGIDDYGFYPRDLRTAHDDLARAYARDKESKEEQKFIDAVSRYRYHCSKKDKDGKYKGRYFITVPETPEDLCAEGRAMHNCVAMYQDMVAAEYTQIYFMRSTAEPEKSLITIEVKTRRLEQVKAACNKRSNPAQQAFAAGWCRENGFDYEGCTDISEEVKKALRDEDKEK